MRTILSCIVLFGVSACATTSGSAPTATPAIPARSDPAHPSIVACEHDRLACAGSADSEVDRRFCDAAFDACTIDPGLPGVKG